MSGKPERPDDLDCCGSGCNPCIFDVYEERLKKWELTRENTIQSRVLDQIKYLPFLVKSIVSMSESLKVFQFQAVMLKNKNLNSVHIKNAISNTDYESVQERLNMKPGEYLILKGAYSTETISRSYTPVLNEEDFEKGVFTIIISLIANGKMSGFFSKLQKNEIVFWRGPYREFTLDIRPFKHILFFGGGTGLVPIYNISKSLVVDKEAEIWVNVLASFKSTSEIVLREEFRKLTDFWNFRMRIYITNDTPLDFKPHYNETVVFKRLDENAVEEKVRECGDDEFFVVVCGPEGFNKFVKTSLENFGAKDENIFIFW